MKCVRIIGIFFVVSMMLPMLVQAVPTPPSPTSAPRIEDFAGFPGIAPEPLEYMREYPYVTLLVVAAAVGGILYYNRVPFRKQVQKILRLFGAQEKERDESVGLLPE